MEATTKQLRTNLDVRDYQGKTALMLAAEKGDTGIAWFFLFILHLLLTSVPSADRAGFTSAARRSSKQH